MGLARHHVRSALLAVALTLAAAPAADAVPLTARSELELQVTPDGPLTLERPGVLKHRLDGEHVTPGGSGAVWRGVATAETDLGSQPFASVRAESFSTLAVTPGGTRVNAPGESLAVAQLIYDVVLTSIVPPPVPLLLVPFKVEARGSITAEVVGDRPTTSVIVGAIVYIDGFRLIELLLLGSGDETVLNEGHFLTEPGQLVEVRLGASARATSGGNTTGPLQTHAIATAFADPVFTLDQAAFDEMAREQGFAPFDLSLYFRFEQAGAVVARVPAAPTWLLVLAGVAVTVAGAAAGTLPRRLSKPGVLEVGRAAG